MYEAVTRGIRVRVTPQYLEEESSPEEGKFFWAYTVEISNEGSAPAIGASPTAEGATQKCEARAWSATCRS
jgi:uncharacterized protein affecting Mg2+/Co2+ transport